MKTQKTGLILGVTIQASSRGGLNQIQYPDIIYAESNVRVSHKEVEEILDELLHRGLVQVKHGSNLWTCTEKGLSHYTQN